MTNKHTILLASSDEGLIETARAALDAVDDYRLVLCRDEKEAAQRLQEIETHLLVCDADCLGAVDSNTLHSARVAHPRVSRILVSSRRRVEFASAVANRAAVYMFLVKPVRREQIALVAKRALEFNELSRRHRLLSRELKISMDADIFGAAANMEVRGGVSKFERLVYASPQMFELVGEARQAATTELPVVIYGETGTGKELLARAIHYNSSRMNSPMHVQNCGGVSEATLHSELFGHVRGAFTGAIADRLGLFRAADGGTVLLDEISEISPEFQVSLLRFLQEGEVKPLGSDKVRTANVRIITASNRSLEEMVAKGLFRRDLYYRLKGFVLQIPPLRDRREDIPALTEFFLEKYAGVIGRRVAGVTEEALAKLAAYDYPGNVRELENEIRRMVAIAEQGGYISMRHLSSAIRAAEPAPSRGPAADLEGGTLKEMVESLERQVVAGVLARCRWNRSRAANELGLSRVGLANKIKRYGLHET